MTEEPSRPTPIDLNCAGGLNDRRLDHVIESLQPLLLATEPRRYVLNLDRVEFCTPCALAVIRSTLEAAGKRGLVIPGSEVISPRNDAVWNYIRRMDALEGLINWEEPEPFRRHDPYGFAPLVRFPTDCRPEEAAAALCHSITRPLDPDSRLWLQSSLSELTDNVVFHADGSVGVAGAQTYEQMGEIELTIVDRGCGIPTSLRRNPLHAPLTDDQALLRSLELRVSGLLDKARGLGLWYVSQTVERNGGRLQIRAGTHMLAQAGSTRRVLDCRPYWPGTIVVVRLRLDRPMTIADVLDEHLPMEAFDGDLDFEIP